MKTPIVYDPNNELTEEQLNQLGDTDFDAFLDYLDQKAAHLKKFTKPLDAYHLKRYAAITKKNETGESLSNEEIKKLQKLGDENNKKSEEEIEKDLEWKEKKYEMLKKSFGVKNVKTHRSQWFD